jgi:hypothetical protein
MQQKWPTYEVAPDDSIHALGVVSINYTRFERTHVWMLAAVGNLSEFQATSIIGRLNTIDRGALIERLLQNGQLPNIAVTNVKHYLQAMKILVENRNILIHSNIIRGAGNEPAIYSTKRNGDTSLMQGTLQLIRDVADELNTYFYFGLNVANLIASEYHPHAREEGMLVPRDWSEPPAIPIRLRDRSTHIT